MKRPSFLRNLPTIDLQVVASGNVGDGEGGDLNEFSLGSTRYNQDGLSIGRDYVRLDGTTITRGKVSPAFISLEETIGRGAFNKVQRAIWKDPETSESKDVAVKEYALLSSTSPNKRRMLIQELRSLCQMMKDDDESCLVKMFGAFLEEDSIIIVLEFMNRGSLEYVMERRNCLPFTQPMVAGVAFQLLKGLDYLHKRKVIHRDVKTENCLMNSNGELKLCDFGLASLGDQSLHNTVVGTTKFMAPERLRAQQYGRASDIWSLALVLCQLVTGKKPWSSVSSMVDLIVTIEETHQEVLIPPNIEKEFREILMGCLQKSPQKRMPAAILLKSPWFTVNHEIATVRDATRLVLDAEESQ